MDEYQEKLLDNITSSIMEVQKTLMATNTELTRIADALEFFVEQQEDGKLK